MPDDVWHFDIFRLPIPEQMELHFLWKVKAIVEKIASYLPDGWIRHTLHACI